MAPPTADGDGFYVLDRRSYVPTILTQGPWDPGAQHGGPVAGLLATVADAMPSLVPMQIARLTVDLLRPVPLEVLDVEREVVREGKRIQVVDVALLAPSGLVARASVLRVRVGADQGAAAALPPAPTDLPGPERAGPPVLPTAYRPGIRQAVQLRVVPPEAAGGRAIMWLRIDVPLVAGHPGGAVPLLAVAADFTSLIGSGGISARWSAINADLNLHVLRSPGTTPGWLALEGGTAFSDRGVGQSRATLHDADGVLGSTSCAQVVERRH